MAKQTKRIVLKNVRFSYLKVFKPARTESGIEKYSTTILIPKNHPQLPELRKAIAEIMDAVWPNMKNKASLHNPLRDGDKETDSKGNLRPGYEGCWFINAYASVDYPPQVVDARLQPARASDWASGDWGNVSISLFDFDVSTKRGVGAGLGNIQFIRKGEPLGGARRAEDDFSVEEVEDIETF